MNHAHFRPFYFYIFTTISSISNLTFGRVAYLSSSLLYQIGNTTLANNQSFSSPKISLYAFGSNHSIGQASMCFEAKNANVFPSAIFTCLEAQIFLSSTVFEVRNPFIICSYPETSALDTHLI